jgi:hemerythrin
MEKIEWMPDFNIGFEEIDNDHQEIFNVALNIQEKIDKRDFAACRNLVIHFIDITAQHFEKEEEFLLRVGYPEFEKHRHEHETFLSKAKELKEALNNEKDRKSIVNRCMEMVSMLADDIVRGDADFKSFLDAHGFA